MGPACSETDSLVKMIDAGMNVARLDFQHGDHESHGASVDRLRDALKHRPDAVCAVMLDVKGSEIQLGSVAGGSVALKKDQELEICTDPEHEGDATKIGCNYPGITQSVQNGSTIHVGSGREGSFTCQVIEVLEDGIKVKVKKDATIGNRWSISLPGAMVDLPPLTEKDEDDITEFGLKKGVDMVAAFVRKADDVNFIREVLG